MISEINSSADKALTIFAAICDRAEPCTMAEIVRLTGFQRTVAGRLVAALVKHNFLAWSEESSTYSVDPRLMHLVQKSLINDPLMTRVDLIMREIVARTGDTALYMVESDLKALVIKRVEGTTQIRVLGSRVGMTLPLHCGGAPSALLAFSGDDVIEEYLGRPLDRRTAATCTDPVALRETLREIRGRGYSVGQEDLFEYVVALGAPVFDERGRLAGAVSVGNIIQRYPPERIHEVGQALVEVIKQY